MRASSTCRPSLARSVRLIQLPSFASLLSTTAPHPLFFSDMLPLPTNILATAAYRLSSSSAYRPQAMEDAQSEAPPPQQTTITRTLNRKTCTSCYEDRASNQFPIRPHGLCSDNTEPYCMRCWRSHIKEIVSDRNRTEVSCLYCNESLTQIEIKKIANKKLYTQ